ncbi:hypothetical protein TWF594_000141 [Orbilia oligospora]|nr:hypothetical protein TWF594_000141 [Orbilia oligospora]
MAGTTYEVSSPTVEAPMTYEKKLDVLEPTVLETQPTFPPSEEKMRMHWLLRRPSGGLGLGLRLLQLLLRKETKEEEEEEKIPIN